MLSEERIEELAAAATWSVPKPHYLNALSPAREAIRTAIAEATAAERERLMEVVCGVCGQGDASCLRKAKHCVNDHDPDGSPIPKWDLSRAEYLRLHGEQP